MQRAPVLFANNMEAASILETLMILSFGISWPLSIIKSIRSKSTQGKSLLFMLFIFFGYICGILSKFFYQSFNLAFWFYFPNLIMVGTDICLYFKNKRRESLTEK